MVRRAHLSGCTGLVDRIHVWHDHRRRKQAGVRAANDGLRGETIAVHGNAIGVPLLHLDVVEADLRLAFEFHRPRRCLFIVGGRWRPGHKRGKDCHAKQAWQQFREGQRRRVHGSWRPRTSGRVSPDCRPWRTKSQEAGRFVRDESMNAGRFRRRLGQVEKTNRARRRSASGSVAGLLDGTAVCCSKRLRNYPIRFRNGSYSCRTMTAERRGRGRAAEPVPSSRKK
jgi:hypothetical protein